MLTVEQQNGCISTTKILTNRRLRVHEIQWRPSSKCSDLRYSGYSWAYTLT